MFCIILTRPTQRLFIEGSFIGIMHIDRCEILFGGMWSSLTSKVIEICIGIWTTSFHIKIRIINVLLGLRNIHGWPRSLTSWNFMLIDTSRYQTIFSKVIIILLINYVVFLYGGSPILRLSRSLFLLVISIIWHLMIGLWLSMQTLTLWLVTFMDKSMIGLQLLHIHCI